MNRKKRILIVTPYFPYPPLEGGKVRIYNLLKFLSTIYDIFLLSFILNLEEGLFLLKLKKFCKEVYLVLRETSPWDIKTADSYPQQVKNFYSSGMVATLKEIIKSHSIDLVQIDFIIMANYVNFISNVPVIFTQHDASNLSFERSIHSRELSETERFADWQKLVQFEQEICCKFNKIIVLTEEDRQQLKSFLPYKVDISVVPTGVDIDYFQPNGILKNRINRTNLRTKARNNGTKLRINAGMQSLYFTNTEITTQKAALNLIYIGHYLHYPNEDAVVYFCEKVFPLISKKLPKVKLWLVGSDPTPKILKLKSNPRIIITGEVPDIRPYLEKADVFVAPLRVGGGIKGKLLEAMAMCVPVVANKLGASGIEAVSGKEIIIVDKPDEFAEKTVELLKKSTLRDKITRNARQLVEKKYNWRIIIKKLDYIYQETISHFSAKSSSKV